MVLVMWLFLAIYYRMCKLWILSQRIEVRQSKTLYEKIQEYRWIRRHLGNDEQDKTSRATFRELYMQYQYIQNVISRRKSLYLNFHLLMIILTLSVSIFSVTLFAFGYFVFCMVLIQDSQNIYNRKKGIIRILTKFMLPYMILDIALI